MAQSDSTRAATAQYVGRTLLYRFGADKVTDLAAGMTYYLVLSVFPLVLAVISIINIVGGANRLVPAIENAISSATSPEVSDVFTRIIHSFLASEGAGLTLVVSLVAAIWSASNYIGAFARAVNTVYQVREGRNFVKLKAIQLLMTLLLVLLIVVLVAALMVSAPAASWMGNLVGLGPQFAAVWGWLRYPLVGVVVVILVQMLYFAAPNVRQPRVRVLSAGSLLAIVLAVIIVEVFSIYLSYFNGANSYAKTYGALAGVVIALFLMYLINMALVLGAEMDAVLERLRQLKMGLPAESGLVLPPRDSKGITSTRATRAGIIERGASIRERALADGAKASAWYIAQNLDTDRDKSLDADSAASSPS